MVRLAPAPARHEVTSCLQPQLHIYDDADIIDEDGMELRDLALAKHEAIRGARDMMAEQLVAGHPLKLFHRVEIADEHGEVLAVIPFREIVLIQE
jgi:hypothetical protein